MAARSGLVGQNTPDPFPDHIRHVCPWAEKHKENAKKALAEAKARKKKEIAILRAKEKNGPKGLEPTRYGDWERKGITYDF